MSEEEDRRRLLEELTDSQRTCLLLVKEGFTSKEIARQTGLTPQTVDQYMSRAASILGVQSRREAARILTEVLDPQFSSSELSSPTVADGTEMSAKTALPDSGQPTRQQPEAASPIWGHGFLTLVKELLKLPPVGGARHDLGWTARVAIIARVALVAAVLVASLLAITRGAIYLLTA